MHLAVTLDPKAILDSLHPYGESGLWLLIFAETGLLLGSSYPVTPYCFHCRAARV